MNNQSISLEQKFSHKCSQLYNQLMLSLHLAIPFTVLQKFGSIVQAIHFYLMNESNENTIVNDKVYHCSFFRIFHLHIIFETDIPKGNKQMDS